VGKQSLLLQLAKTDRSPSGKQLLALLSMEQFDVARARCTLQKNAYALLRLKRYRDAAAVFLLSRPPMVKEACSVLSKQHLDPPMAFLVARRMEGHTDTGAALGPVARSILALEILPGGRWDPRMQEAVDEDADGTPLSPPQTGSRSVRTIAGADDQAPLLDGSIVAMVAACWLQSRSTLQTVMHRAIHPLMLVHHEEVGTYVL